MNDMNFMFKGRYEVLYVDPINRLATFHRLGYYHTNNGVINISSGAIEVNLGTDRAVDNLARRLGNYYNVSIDFCDIYNKTLAKEFRGNY